MKQQRYGKQKAGKGKDEWSSKLQWFETGRGQKTDPRRKNNMSDIGHVCGIRTGKSGYPAKGSGLWFSLIYPEKPETVSDPWSQRRGKQRSSLYRRWCGSGKGFSKIPHLQKRWTCRRVYRHWRVLAGWFCELSDRMQLLFWICTSGSRNSGQTYRGKL